MRSEQAMLPAARADRPRCGHQRATAVGQHQEQLELAAAVAPAQHFQRVSLEGMARTDDLHLLRVAVEVVVGSVSSLPLRVWITTPSFGPCGTTPTTHGSVCTLLGA